MNTLNGIKFKEMLVSGAAHLSNRYQEIDALNVFPVPDGDTGTNMSMTFSSGVKSAIDSHSEQLSVLAKKLSKGLLMGARGNSGVITSQIFRGIYQSISDQDELDAQGLAKAFVSGAEVAYKAVMRPVEGTILTVIREGSFYAQEYVTANPSCTVEEFFEKLIEYSKESLDNTPELLPVLKEVGVVDSGGAGLVVILEGFQAALLGKPFVKEAQTTNTETVITNFESEEFGYCTEFIIRLSDKGMAIFSEQAFQNALARIGESIVVVQDEELVKVHVHTLTPGDALNMGQRYGEFMKLKIENMQEQHSNIQEEVHATEIVEEKEFALIACVAGEGLSDLFKEYRCDYVIAGGQTMNPSTEDFVEAINKVNARNIILLPNNSNIILAAQQAAEVSEGKNVSVIASKTIPQGLSACIMFNPEVTMEENIEEMTQAVEHVKTGQVTYAIKDTTFEGLEIKEGDFMGMFEKNIVISTKDEYEACSKLLDKMITDDSEILTVISGDGVSEEAVNRVVNYVDSKYKIEVEVVAGQQPVYSFIFAVE